MKIKDIENAPCHFIIHHMAHMMDYQVMKYLQGFGLKPGHARILFILNCEGNLSQKALAGKAGVKPPSVTVALKKLEKLSYISRETDPKDQRIIRIALTEKGKRCVEEVRTVAAQMEKRVFRGFSDEERILVRRLLIQMWDNVMVSKEFMNINKLGKEIHTPYE